MNDTDVLDDDRVVLDETSRSPKDDDATVRRVRDDVVSDDAIGTTETDAVSPLLERVRTARADIIVLNDGASASEWPFRDVKARPRAGVKRVNVFNLTKTWLSFAKYSPVEGILPVAQSCHLPSQCWRLPG
jgi:hypothetical protein